MILERLSVRYGIYVLFVIFGAQRARMNQIVVCVPTRGHEAGKLVLHEVDQSSWLRPTKEYHAFLQRLRKNFRTLGSFRRCRYAKPG